MPYVNNKFLSVPPSGQLLFRYMSTSKFLSMITSSTLFFPSLGKLAASDPFEGSPGLLNYISLSVDWSLLSEKDRSFFSNDERFYNLFRIGKLEGYEDNKSYLNETIFVNCWHASEHESDAMWRVYSELSEGVAIVTDIDRMKSAIIDERHSVYVGSVDYIDQRAQMVDNSHHLKYAMWKRREFSHEREVRLITDNMDNIDFCGDGIKPKIKDKNKNFVTVNVDLNHLVKFIIFNPRSESWYREAILKIIGIAGFSWAVKPSSFEETPLSPTGMIQQLRDRHSL